MIFIERVTFSWGESKPINISRTWGAPPCINCSCLFHQQGSNPQPTFLGESCFGWCCNCSVMGPRFARKAGQPMNAFFERLRHSKKSSMSCCSTYGRGLQLVRENEFLHGTLCAAGLDLIANEDWQCAL